MGKKSCTRQKTKFKLSYNLEHPTKSDLFFKYYHQLALHISKLDFCFFLPVETSGHNASGSLYVGSASW